MKIFPLILEYYNKIIMDNTFKNIRPTRGCAKTYRRIKYFIDTIELINNLYLKEEHFNIYRINQNDYYRIYIKI